MGNLMNNIRLIAFDLDGTLLDNQKRLSFRNAEALKKCVAQGIEIVPCTGRIWPGVPDCIRELPGIHYAITTNGAVVEDLRAHRVLDERKMSWQKAVEILTLGQQFDTMYDAYAGGISLGEARFIDNMERFGLPVFLQQMIRSTRQVVPDVIARVTELAQPVEKVNYFFSDMEERSRARKVLEARGDVIVSSSYSYNLEINEPGANKGEALLRLAKHLGLKPEQTMGFGDGENDMTMVQMAGIGVAMANGMECVKAAADYVTAVNDEDGVAAALEWLLWNGQKPEVKE